MIFGIVGHTSAERTLPELQAQSTENKLTASALARLYTGKAQEPRWSTMGADALVAMLPTGVATLDANLASYSDLKTGSFAVLHGNIFNRAELAAQHLGTTKLANSAEVALRLVQELGEKAFAQLNGNFVLAIWEASAQRFYLVRDHLGVEPVYYARKQGVLFFASDLQSVTRIPSVGRKLNLAILQRYLLFNYNPGFDTLFDDVHALRPGFFIKIERSRMSMTQYWRPSFADTFNKDAATYKTELLELLSDAVRLRLAGDKFRPGAFLSGGMDSSSVVHFMHGHLQRPIATFSFRCRGKSFDESHYARIMSERYQTQHQQVEYSPEDAATRIITVAQSAQEPFSDIGIEVASLLLGANVAEHADYVLTGDGGDELFGGHPVYLADRAADMFEKIPGFVRAPLTKTLQYLPDTDDKKSLQVKLKRFSYSAAFPSALHSNRWRIYYTDAELRRLFAPDMLANVNGHNPYRELLEIYQEADGKDFLSRTLYGDYYSVVGFYLRRMELIRKFGVEGRMPLLDYRLVDYTARIPSELKLDKKGQTKVILHQVMTGELPDEIVFRKDKLGHSVPMKNWMRESATIQNLLKEYLNPQTVRRRGFFNANLIEQMMNEHQRKAHNHSHRLWALLVFELWCRANLDGKPEASLA